MSEQTRFGCPSAGLTLRALLKGSGQVLWMGLGLAIAVHGALSQLQARTRAQRAARPLTTQFVKRQPRLTKPLELKRLPRPKQRTVQRTMVAVKARVAAKRTVTGVQPGQVVRSLARPGISVGRPAGFEAVALEPQVGAQLVAGAREDRHVVDMSLEMVDIEALDTGQYHAMVIEDPSDKRRIKGFFHIILARPRSLSRFGGRGGGTSVWDDMKLSVGLVVQEMNRHTEIVTDIVGQITFDNAELFKVPWVMTPVSDPRVYTTPSEARTMGRYLMLGGFQFLENAWGVPGMVEGLEKATRRVAEETFAAIGMRRGKDWEYEFLPESHPVYHCFFDFNGPPAGKDMGCFHAKAGRTVCDYLEGITIDGRLWLLFSQKGYSIGIHDSRPGGYYEGQCDPLRAAQFCVNTIIFALTQEGSITKQVMQQVR